MAILTKNAVSRRIAAVIAAKYEGYKADISSTVPSLASVKAGPIEKGLNFPVVGVYFQSHTGEDVPQQTGENRTATWIVEILDKFADFGADNSQRPEDISDVIEYLLKKQKDMLDPVTGAKLPWLFQVWPTASSFMWIHSGGRLRAGALITITVTVDIYEAEVY